MIQELAFVAGVLEGEGSFLSTPDGRPRVSMRMTDVDVVRRVAAVIGGRVTGPYDYGNKPLWQTGVQDSARAAGVMMTLWPFMGERRQEQIAGALKKWRKRTPKRGPSQR